MNRRQALLAAITLLGGTFLDGALPVWAYEGTRGAKGQPGRFFNASEMALLADVAEIMIPATDTPGAMAANVHGVVDGLMLDWAVPATRAARSGSGT
ncbi:MAG: gluconate 2-dehydrogenase subunit 3 family protein [Niveispirillum sp.]|nr:gluconate 2-dehydrogenase subunit 3 family protein [Niveispirillum sp.]